MTRTALPFYFLVFLLTVFFLKPASTQAIGIPESTGTRFADFRQSVQNGEAGALRGVYVQNVLELPVVQQPADNLYYVSNRNGETTQFALASHYGNMGLLAHNTLSGRLFSELSIGQEVRLVYGDGKLEYFVVKQSLRFQALDPESITSTFRNLDRNETLSAGEMFNRIYRVEGRLIFQTCIEANGNASWGRLFVIAIPKE